MFMVDENGQPIMTGQDDGLEEGENMQQDYDGD